MKLQPDKSNSLTINAYGPGWIEVNGQRFTGSLIVSSMAGAHPQAWEATKFEDLRPLDFEVLAQSGAELALFGSGQRLRFPQPAWLACLIQKGIGLETMDTAAACRTYNILASEGRKVVVALLLET
ncbi:Mth938-like domain-containing protein [Limnohabitans sp. DCL3]|uniref:Mth938-like domain-containing protein n=1 Tax=Limnohabitans sp. DCL3 TaxID=3374103 RepID=UPI003A8C0C5F